MNRPEIDQYLPHAGNMILIERVIFSNARTIRCACHDASDCDHPLQQDGVLPITAGIEYAAQAVALHAATTGPCGEITTGRLAILQNVRWHTERLDAIHGDLEITADQLALMLSGLHYRFSLQTRDRDLITGELFIAVEGAGL